MMKQIFVAGLINIETTLKVDSFPVDYQPVRYPFFGVNSTVSGVGYNVAKALTTLGGHVTFAALIGSDMHAHAVRNTLNAAGVTDDLVLSQLQATPQSVIIYEPSGRRMIHVDLKDIQQTVYPPDKIDDVLAPCDLAVLCNINFSRPMLARAKALGKTIATDVHALDRLDDEYNADYMRAADILFMSHERLPMPPQEWVQHLWQHYDAPIIVIGLGTEGALLAVRRDHFIDRIPAVQVRPVVNTIGAGDALFSAFVYHYAHTHNPYAALKRAVVFAAHKIGVDGAANGFMTTLELDRLCAQIYGSTP